MASIVEASAPEHSRAGRARVAAVAAVVVVGLFAAAVRLRLADVPLERDEGEYAYAGQLLLQGIPPYQLAYNMKFPGTYYAYAAILALFGESARGIHLGLLGVNAATTLGVFFLARRLFGNLAAAVAGAAFALLSLDRMIMGVFAHATHFVLLPMVVGLLLVLRAIDSRRAGTFFASGVMLGFATLMKQHAVFFVPLGVGLVARAALRHERAGWRAAATRSAWLLAGAALPLALLAVLLTAHGVLDRFWFWTFQVAAKYVTEVSLSKAPSEFVSKLRLVTSENLPIWIAASIGAAALLVRRDQREARILVLGLLGASFLALCPGFYFREHYFILLLPVTALLIGVAADSCARVLAVRMSQRSAALLTAGLCVALAATYVLGEREYLFSMSPRDVSRQRYGRNPFVESPEIARYIRERTGPDDRIAVLGSEPQIYFHAGRRSATGYLYVYPLMERGELASAMQEEMIREIEAAHPTYLVSVPIVTSWLSRPWSDRRLTQWLTRYVRECYDKVGIADISTQATHFAWDADVATYQPKSRERVFTYRRKSEAPCGVSR